VFLIEIPSSGKSTFVLEKNLTPYTVFFRQLQDTSKAACAIHHMDDHALAKNNPIVWGLIYSLIRCRMEDGDFTILDATNAGNADISKYRKLVKDNRCKAYCVDFSDVPLEIAKKRNM
jgi:predicted kinase